MRIKSIKIENLFEIFDYDISFANNENVLIITGPNGFGKTMILNIIFNLFNRKFQFFKTLVFNKITIIFDDAYSVVIVKDMKADKQYVKINFFNENTDIGYFDYSDKLEEVVERKLERYLPIRRISSNKWINHGTNEVLTTDDILNVYADQLSEEMGGDIFRISSHEVNKILDSIKVHLIKKQRLFRKVVNPERNYRPDKEQTIIIETIQTYAEELKKIISDNLKESFKISQNLDSSYPNRLVQETKRLTEKEYAAQFEILKNKQQKLANYGLYESERQLLRYNQDDSKALSVYLNDLDKKLSIFDGLVEKLDLFTGILNERRFTFKTIRIDKEKGFYFKTTKSKELELNQLSSGEQHEVVILYELIFKATQNTLVLIDEPEISLHITWQKEFLNDLLRIIKIQNIQVIIATHAPSIINDRWDLVYNLEKVSSK
jgi:predicted ATP-binding protein involved in virulence